MKSGLKLLNIFNKKIYHTIFFFVYFFLLFYLIYITSKTLPPFRDEAVSLTANISFFLDNLKFQGTVGTKFEGLYNPYLTSPPLSAVGSVIGWLVFDDFNLIRLSNFIWVLFVQMAFSVIIAKTYLLDIKKIIIYSSFTLVSFPFWFGSIYSLGETISIIIFFNSLFLYKYYPKLTIFLIGWIFFFGKLIVGFLFIFFYITNLIINKNFRQAPLEILIYFIPSFLWLVLVYFKSDFLSIGSYFNSFLTIYQGNDYIGDLSILSIFNIKSITSNFQNLDWNVSVVLRVFLPPLLLFMALIIGKGKGVLLDLKQLTYTVVAIAPIYAWFIVISPDKPLIYATHFTYPVLIYSFYLLSNKELNISLVNNVAFFICSLYMTSNLLFLFALGALFTINFMKKPYYQVISLLIILSLINSVIETSKEQMYTVDLEICKNNIISNNCYEYLMTTKDR